MTLSKLLKRTDVVSAAEHLASGAKVEVSNNGFNGPFKFGDKQKLTMVRLRDSQGLELISCSLFDDEIASLYAVLRNFFEEEKSTDTSSHSHVEKSEGVDIGKLRDYIKILSFYENSLPIYQVEKFSEALDELEMLRLMSAECNSQVNAATDAWRSYALENVARLAEVEKQRDELVAAAEAALFEHETRRGECNCAICYELKRSISRVKGGK